ncbi:MAG: VCBS repeat-containing protein [Candidatus Kapabacteria bacterium]|nr:VCBS repeat-containing protein [Candidatus Kapabacteria bacterium]
MNAPIRAVVLIILFSVLGSEVRSQKLFTRMLPEQTGVDYRHDYDRIKISKDSLGRVNSMVPGCGVAIGDITGDGKPDVVFSSFGGPGFYRNDGDWKYTNISEKIGYPIDSLQFATGLNLVDIDADGDLDLFVARWQSRCRLLINDGHGVFTEHAADYGLDFQDETVNSAFFDYDGDGLLDCYLVVYSNYYSLVTNNMRSDSAAGAESERLQRSGSTMPKFESAAGSQREETLRKLNERSPSELRHAGHADKLYKNKGNGTFEDVTYTSWMNDDGMGLSATVADINLDGHPDLYVANDFNSTDLIYLNNGDGTFAESMMRMTRRASIFSMGSDIADLNGDGLPDIITTDMLPDNHFRRILNAGNNGDMSIYNPTYDSNQVSRNMVQLNRGYNQFSEIGYMTGMTATDWSWACLIQDFDLDGLADVFIGNGYTSDISNQDYVYNVDARQKGLMPKMGFLTEPNHLFRQRGYLDFVEAGVEWGVADTSTTFGAAYGDLDGDVDLDLVVANMDTVAFVYRNNAVEQKRGSFVAITFKGDGANTSGLGTKVRVVAGNRSYYQEHFLVRGYQSRMDDRMIIGVGAASIADSIIVQWPDGRAQILTQQQVNKVYAFSNADATPPSTSLFALPEVSAPLFTDASSTSGLNFVHSENLFDDFKRYRLMPTRVSWGGPAVAVGDLNNDGLDDVMFGASKGRSISTFLQKTPGTFIRSESGLTGVDTTYESQAMVLVDIDNDGDRDLVIAGGGAEYAEDDIERGLRVYLNNGKGMLSRVVMGVPRINTNAATINACDYDGDGDFDLFIGGGVKTDMYPFADSSYVLENRGKGTFVDVTDRVMPGVRNIGIVRTALWSDVDADGRFDLFLTGEWMPLTIMHNDGATFSNVTEKAGLAKTTGWWYSLIGADVDNDGDMDYVAGNLGLNSRYQTSVEKPIEIFAADFDDNGSIDPLITWWFEGKRHIIRDRGKVFSQMPTLNRKFNEFVDFAVAPIEKVVEKDMLDTCYHRALLLSESVVLINDGTGRFTISPLPAEAQIAPVLGMEALDLNGDSWMDLVLVGNIYGAEDDVVRYDAGKGLVLLGSGDGKFVPQTLPESGFASQFDARGLVSIRNPGSASAPLVLISAVNQGHTLTYLPLTRDIRVQRVDPMKVTSAVFAVGSGQRRTEVYCGSGYRSQTSCNLLVPPGATSVTTYLRQKKSGTIAVRNK